MNEKEKAIELFKKYTNYTDGWDFDDKAKECAKIAVKEILNSRPIITDNQIEYSNYWNQVLKEIDLI